MAVLFLLLSLLLSGPSWAAKDTPCFDFTHLPLAPLRDPSSLPKLPGEDAKASGENADGGDWAAMRGEVQAPLALIAEWLKDPVTIKDPAKVKIERKELPLSGFDAHYALLLSFKPIFFVTVEWKEEWAHQKFPGKKNQPERSLTSYAKVDGTSHIQKLCGSILLEAISPKATDVFLVEALDATHQGAEDLLKGHEGTLRTLRAKAK